MYQLTSRHLPAWMRLTGLTLLLACALFTSGALTSGTVHAQQATITTITDCSNDSQLRNAIKNAASGDTIRFGCSGDIFTGDLFINKDLTLDGNGLVALDGESGRQVLIVERAHLTLNALTIANGYASLNGPLSGGGGLENGGGTVTISNSTFAYNSADGFGGGISNEGGTVTISNSTFAYNSSLYGKGGGISNVGTMTISNSSFNSNSARYDGGGLYNVGSVKISNSTFTNNSAQFYGGALDNGGGSISTSGTATITNSTFAHNSASIGGGGLDTINQTTTISSSTFAYNSAPQGGGLYRAGSNGTIHLIGSIVAKNTSGNCFGSMSDGGYNLSYSGNCGLTASTSRQNIDPKLASALADNGGPTQTLALLAGSPAIDQIPTSTNLCPTTDQRGAIRPDNRESRCDIGAYEAN